MKKVIIPVVILTIAAFFIYKFYYQKQKVQNNKEIPMAVTTNDSLTSNVGAALQAYYTMKDAFIKSDTALVNSAASNFSGKILQVEMEGLQADTTILELAVQLKQSISGETNNLLAVKDIAAKRKSFQAVSDGLFDFLRTIRYTGSKVYQQYCPMAFDNNGAAWLSNSSEIVNPYFGEKMLHCGDVRDSVNITK
ncbi:DUF3347 domain-containing protein [soil metagenome]